MISYYRYPIVHFNTMETTQYKTNIYFDITQKTSDYTLLFVKLHFMLLAWKLPTFENMKINT